MRTIYVVSDSELEGIKRNKRQAEVKNIEASHMRLEENNQARVKILNDLKNELHEEFKALAPAEKT
tara:strand:- start:1225 stop:1422 length:198 start_codon:yes stop_codon:yes gene_type:complete